MLRAFVFSVFGRCLRGFPLKELYEVTGVGDADIVPHGIYRDICLFKKCLGLLDPDVVEILKRRVAVVVLEFPAEPVFAYKEPLFKII